MVAEVSVVIPSHRTDDMLWKAISTILDSQNCEIEIIVVLNGKAYGDFEGVSKRFEWETRVKVLATQESGIVPSLNLGISQAGCEYIARMDGDDLALPTRLRRQLDYLRRHPHCVAVATQVVFVCQHGTRLGKSNYPPFAFTISDYFPLATPVAHPSSMFRKRDWLRVGGYSQDYNHAEDHDFWNKLLKFGYLRVLSKVGIYYRVHDQQISIEHSTAQSDSTFFANLAAVSRDAESYFRKARLSDNSYQNVLNSYLKSNSPVGLRTRVLLRRIVGNHTVRTLKTLQPPGSRSFFVYLRNPFSTMAYFRDILVDSLSAERPRRASCKECTGG